jgi:hypothetical protein
MKAYIDKKFAKFSLICPIRMNAKFFGHISCAYDESAKVFSMLLIVE